MREYYHKCCWCFQYYYWDAEHAHYELNECGPFGGIDHDVSEDAPPEPNHGACDVADVVHCVVIGYHADGTPMCKESGGGHGGH